MGINILLFNVDPPIYVGKPSKFIPLGNWVSAEDIKLLVLTLTCGHHAFHRSTVLFLPLLAVANPLNKAKLVPRQSPSPDQIQILDSPTS